MAHNGVDETLIPRRPEGWRELSEIGAGCSPGTEGCGPEETAQGEVCALEV